MPLPADNNTIKTQRKNPTSRQFGRKNISIRKSHTFHQHNRLHKVKPFRMFQTHPPHIPQQNNKEHTACFVQDTALPQGTITSVSKQLGCNKNWNHSTTLTMIETIEGSSLQRLWENWMWNRLWRSATCGFRRQHLQSEPLRQCLPLVTNLPMRQCLQNSDGSTCNQNLWDNVCNYGCGCTRNA